MKDRVVQIAVIPETEEATAEIVVLTEEGNIYRTPIGTAGEGEWFKIPAPERKNIV